MRYAKAIHAIVLVQVMVLSGAGVAAEKALTNQDVLEISKLGLGDQVVIAKIKQAQLVDFKLDAEGLGALKRGGASAAVIQAMLAKTTGAEPVPTPPNDPGAPPDEHVYVRLRTATGDLGLRMAKGSISTTGIGFAFTHMDYPGVKAWVRTRDMRPSLLVTSQASIDGGNYFLVRLDVDSDDRCRSLKLGSLKQRLKLKSRTVMQPDRDFVVPVTITQAAEALWKLDPRTTLEPGEYGLYADMKIFLAAFPVALGFPQRDTSEKAGAIFDFGVDP